MTTQKKLASSTVRPPAKRGFAAMPPRLQRMIAAQGGLAVSRDREHMARIGAIGGGAGKGKGGKA